MRSSLRENPLARWIPLSPMWRAGAWSCVWLSPQALSVPELPSSDDSHCGNNHGSHLAPRLLRSSSCRSPSGSKPSIWWGDAKTGISSLSLMRKLGVNYRTALLLHNKIMPAMSEREKSYVLHGKVKLDDAYLGGEHNGGSLVADQRTRCQSLPPSPLMRLVILFT